MKKHFALLTLLSALCLGFSSCGSDDDSNTPADPTTGTKQLAKFQVTASGESEIYTMTLLDNATYKNGKVASATFTMVDEDGTHSSKYTIDSSESGQLDITCQSGSSSSTFRGTLNSNGFLTSVLNCASYEYNSDGQLTKITDETLDCTYEFTYSNGDLTKIVANNQYETDITTFTYDGSAVANKGNLPLHAMYMESLSQPLIIYGYLGNASKHLPSTIDGAKITWSFDNQGYPTSAKDAEGAGATFAWK